MEFDSEFNAEKNITCDNFAKMGWMIKKSMEVSHSYGIIKPVDLELTVERILANITYEGPGQLISVSKSPRKS